MSSVPSVLYIVTEPWYFANHRLDHARALIADGFEVHVATRPGDRWDEVEAAGCVMHELHLGRGSGSLAGWLREVRATRRVVRTSRPDIVHAVALKPLAVALSLLVSLHRPSLILSVNGLGLSAAGGGFRMAVIRRVIRFVRHLPRVTLLFQTRSDRRLIVGDSGDGIVIPGVGVDTTKFVPGHRAEVPPCVVVYLGRAVRSKGLVELAAALGSPDDGLAALELHLYCANDEGSPGALARSDMEQLSAHPLIRLHPPTRSPEAVLSGAHGAILPSLAGEGVSKFVLESLASGTPVLVSAESGSAEVIRDGDTGLVFHAHDERSIRAALRTLVDMTSRQRRDMEAACRATAESTFALDVVLPQVVALHRRVAGVSGP